MEERAGRKWRGKVHQVWRYGWINGVPLRDSPDALLVNYLSVVGHEKRGKIVYRNSWVTDQDVRAEHLAVCGRVRWKLVFCPNHFG